MPQSTQRHATHGLRSAAIAALAAVLAGCTAAQSGLPGRTAIGAFAGSSSSAGQPGAAALADALRGGLVAGEMGADLRGDDRRLALAAEYQALEYASVGQPVPWRGANGRVTGEVRAAAPYRVGSQNCRQYVHTLRIGDSTRSARGTACREDDGRWTLLT